jgi:hypothetical protein
MGDRMPKRVDQYRLNAVKCFELSQTFKDPDARRTLFAMADAWRTLATRRVKNIEMPAGSGHLIFESHGKEIWIRNVRDEKLA